MKIIAVHIYRYQLTRTDSTHKRVGILVQLTTEEGQIAYGDIAPLPRWSLETLEQALQQLSIIKPALLQQSPQKLRQILTTCYPSVAFGVESALDRLCHPLSSSSSSIPLCALLQGTPLQILQQATQAIEQAFTHAKIKIASLPSVDAYSILNELKPYLRLRIDVNRAWTYKQAYDFFNVFSSTDFDYIEEPICNSSDLRHFDHPFALDETLREEPTLPLHTLPRLKALIIKPSLTGGYSTCSPLAQQAKRLNIKCILSSAYESGIGILQIAQLAHRLDLHRLPIGLDTYRYLTEDVLDTPLSFDKGVLSFPSAIRLNHSYLQEIKNG